MSEKLPDNVKRLEILRVERGMKKLCVCANPHFVIDDKNRLVYCECGALVDPFDALKDIADEWEEMTEHTEYLLRTRKEIDNYKPHLVVIKQLAELYRGSRMWPTCPVCKEAFDLKEILSNFWVNPEYVRKKREEKPE